MFDNNCICGRKSGSVKHPVDLQQQKTCKVELQPNGLGFPEFPWLLCLTEDAFNLSTC